MAKKVSKNAKVDRGNQLKRDMVKVIQAFKSSKSGAYTFKEDIVDADKVSTVIK